MDSTRAPSLAPAQNGWIGGARFDLAFFFGSGLLAALAGALAVARPTLLLPMWFLWTGLVEGPHLVATWQRTYFDARMRREQGRLLLTSLAWMLPGPLALLATWISGRPEPFALFLGAAALWSYHHTVRQHHGVLSIYQRLGRADARARKLDSRLLHISLWSGFALFLLIHPANRAVLGIAAPPSILLAAGAVALALLLAAWAMQLALRARRGEPLKPGLFALIVAAGTTLFSMFYVGMHEPLLDNALTPEQIFMAATLVSGTVHGIQYLGIVIATGKRRAASEADPHSLSARLGRAPALAYTLMVALSVLYVGLDVMRGGAWLVPGKGAQACLALYWGLFFHHYWMDQKIWRPSADPRLRAELGLGAA
ncbi:MAG: hypothetical protein V4582_21250 [Pseudomonadota bacterium]